MPGQDAKPREAAMFRHCKFMAGLSLRRKRIEHYLETCKVLPDNGRKSMAIRKVENPEDLVKKPGHIVKLV